MNSEDYIPNLIIALKDGTMDINDVSIEDIAKLVIRYTLDSDRGETKVVIDSVTGNGFLSRVGDELIRMGYSLNKDADYIFTKVTKPIYYFTNYGVNIRSPTLSTFKSITIGSPMSPSSGYNRITEGDNGVLTFEHMESQRTYMGPSGIARSFFRGTINTNP